MRASPRRAAAARAERRAREAEIGQRLVADAAASGPADRVLLVVESATGRRIAGSLLPRQETGPVLLQAITPWLDEAGRTGRPRLRHGPGGAAARDQRSCIVAPLRRGSERLGFLYVDVEGRHGRFAAADRDRLARLAALGAEALSELRRAEALAPQVRQREAELGVINSIQQGVGAELDFQAIVELVGDKLREVFATGNLMISWRDAAAGVRHILYAYEHGQRMSLPSMPDSLERPIDKAMLARKVVTIDSPAAGAGLGLHHFAGTDQSLSSVFVPMFSGERLLGNIILENYEREAAFGEAEVRLLSTVAASMGVALENARLFAETQRLLKETEQRNAELAVINSIQSALAAELEHPGHLEAVGDKVQEVFRGADVQIRIFDQESQRVSSLRAGRGRALVDCSHRPDRQQRRLRSARVPHGAVLADQGEPGRGIGALRQPCDRRVRSIEVLLMACRWSPAARSVGADRASRARAAACLRRRPTSACCRRVAAAWAWRCRTRACSTRRSDC